MHTLRAFLLTRHWRDTSNGMELSLWAASEQGPLRVVLDGQEAVCFVERAAMPGNGTLANVPGRRRPLQLVERIDTHLNRVEVLSTPERGLGRRETRGNDGVR